MKKKYKYDIGIVHLENNEYVTITQNQLEDEGIRTKYKGKKILDRKKENLLHIRSRGKSSHFFSRGKSRKNIREKKEYSENHKNKIEILYNFLNNRDRVRICNYVFYQNEKYLDTIFSFNDYIFSKEVKQSLSKTDYFISDIFGINKKLHNTNTKPNIAIEVIDSHFPDIKTFNFFRKISEETPLIILFYYLEFEPIINSMFNNTGNTNNGKLRISHYIQDGSFWIGDERIEDKDYSFKKTYITQIDFSNNEEYYKAINELEIAPLRDKYSKKT